MSTIPARPPAILYGTAWKAERTAELVHLAILQGFRGIDTAAQRKHYREDLVGLGVQSACKALGLSRKDIWLQTKFTPISGQDVQGPIPYDPEANVADQVCSSFKHSLQHLHPAATLPDIRQLFIQYAVSAKNGSHQPEAPLQDVYIDSYLFHSPLSTLQATLEAWRVMEALVDAGLVRYIGFSNVYDPHIFSVLFEKARIKPYVLQNRWHASTGHDVSLLAQLSPVLSPNMYPLSLDSIVDAPRGVTYQPFWTLTGNQRLLQSESVARLSSRKGLTPAQVVYAFVSQGMGLLGLSTCVLSGTKDPAHMKEAVEAVQCEPWDDEELASIRRDVYGE